MGDSDSESNSEASTKSGALSWFFRPDPQGLGTLLIGVAALWALFQTSGVLSEIFKIQQQADGITGAVSELKAQANKLQEAVDLLRTQMKESLATRTVEESPALKQENPSEEQIEGALRHIPTKPTQGQATIYIPTSKRPELIENLKRVQTKGERLMILQNSLEYQTMSSK